MPTVKVTPLASTAYDALPVAGVVQVNGAPAAPAEPPWLTAPPWPPVEPALPVPAAAVPPAPKPLLPPAVPGAPAPGPPALLPAEPTMPAPLVAGDPATPLLPPAPESAEPDWHATLSSAGTTNFERLTRSRATITPYCYRWSLL